MVIIRELINVKLLNKDKDFIKLKLKFIKVILVLMNNLREIR